MMLRRTYVKERIALRTPFLVNGILSPGSILSSLELEKGNARSRRIFQDLRHLLESFASTMSNDGRLQLLQHIAANPSEDIVNDLSRLCSLLKKAEDILEECSKDQKGKAAKKLGFRFSMRRYLATPDRLYNDLKDIICEIENIIDCLMRATDGLTRSPGQKISSGNVKVLPKFCILKRIPLGTSSLVDSLCTSDSILYRLKSAKDLVSFNGVFRKLTELFTSISLKMLDRERSPEVVLLEHWHVDCDAGVELVNFLLDLNDYVLRAEDIMEKVSTEMILRHQDGATAEKPRLCFSESKYEGVLDCLHEDLDNTVSHLRELYHRAPVIVSIFNKCLGSSKQGTIVEQENRAGFPRCARGIDLDIHKEVRFPTPESNLGKVMGQTFQFDRPLERDKDLKAIVGLLSASFVDSSRKGEVPVLPILGIPGVGKTTLAWLLYRNEQVCTHFRRRLWLDVSNGFNLDLIAQTIEAIAVKLRWIPGQQEVKQEDPIIGNDARRRLMKLFGRNVQHRFLIIVDGLKVEDQHKWLAFRESLKGTNSHIIITTRHRRAIGEDSAGPYVLQGLSELYSWQYLLDNNMHGKNSTLPKPLPRYIARAMHCSIGVPLFLNIIRHYMYAEPRVLKHEEMITLRSLPSLANDMLQDFVVNLPSNLKNCFTYCSLFPPLHEMDKSTLIHLWMAQGFLATQSDSDAENLGDKYFMDLLERSLLSEAHIDEFGNIKSCKMHKLMHDLALLIDSCDCHHVSDGNLWLDTIITFPTSLRTLLFLDQEEFAYSSLSNPSLECKLQKRIRELSSLRVFDLHQANIDRVPTIINEMKLLRYLDLSRNPNITILTDSITSLIHLQTLKLSHCEKMKELPKGIVGLKNLRHLEIVGCLGLTHMPCGFGQLKALRTLSTFVVGEESGTSMNVGELGELKPLDHLRGKIELRCLEKAKYSSLASSNLEKKEHLESVSLVWETTDADKDADGSIGEHEKRLEALQPHHKLKGFSIQGYQGVNFPKWFSALSNLVKVTVKDSHSCRGLPPLHQLPLLKYLTLENLGALEYITSDISAGSEASSVNNFAMESAANAEVFFRSLKHLSLKMLPNLKGWFVGNSTVRDPLEYPANSFPALSKVTVDDCFKECNLMLPSRVEDLRIYRISRKRLQSLLEQSSPPNLRSLCISDVRDLEYIPETWLSGLSSIENLQIEYCPNLVCLPTFIVSLKTLSVVGCGKLTSLPREIGHLGALETLKLKWCSELDLQFSHRHIEPHQDVDIKWWPQFNLGTNNLGIGSHDQRETDSSYFAGLKSLSYLEILNLPKLVSLPDGICMLRSLQQLSLNYCANLEHLPEGLQNIPHLYKIKIIGCPLLRRRCCDKTSNESQKMHHIWDRELDWDEEIDE